MRRWAKQVGADGRPRKRSWREDERQINLYLLPALRNRKVKDITRRDVRDLVEGIAERRLRKGTTEDGQESSGLPSWRIACWRSSRRCSTSRSIENGANPAARLKPVSPESRRDRVLSPEEIRTLWRELDSEHHRIATLFRTQLLTAQRPGEVSKMRWAQLDPALRAHDGRCRASARLKYCVLDAKLRIGRNRQYGFAGGWRCGAQPLGCSATATLDA